MQLYLAKIVIRALKLVASNLFLFSDVYVKSYKAVINGNKMLDKLQKFITVGTFLSRNKNLEKIKVAYFKIKFLRTIEFNGVIKLLNTIAHAMESKISKNTWISEFLHVKINYVLGVGGKLNFGFPTEYLYIKSFTLFFV